MLLISILNCNKLYWIPWWFERCHLSRTHTRNEPNIWKLWSAFGSTKPYHQAKMGRPSSLTQREKTIIVREARKDPKASSSEIKSRSGAVGDKISQRTIKRVLLQSGLKAYRPLKKPLLTKKHTAARKLWAETYRNWTVDDWKKVIDIFYCLKNKL